MADRKAPGEALSRRLASRSGLYRRSTSDGGEVYSGPVARQALRALGARAMTMDHTILVDEDFDESNPEDAALYAHELHHLNESGGADHPSSQHDAEEMGARAIERMVLHRSEMGESFASIMRDVKQGGGPQVQESSTGSGPETDQLEATSEAEEAYKALRRKGKTHREIVDMLAQHCMELIQKREETSKTRQFGAKRW